MPLYRYVAVDQTGEEIRGTMEGTDERAVMTNVREYGYMVTSIAPTVTENVVAGLAAPPSAVVRRGIMASLFFRVSLRQLVFVMNELHHSIDAGISVGEACMMIGQRTKNSTLRRVLLQMARGTQSGSKFSDEMKRFPTVFPEGVVYMIEAGETSGDLAGMIDRVADFLDYENKMRMKLALQSFYPIALICFALFIPTLLTLFLKGFQPWLHEVALLGAVIGAVVVAFTALRRLLSGNETVRAVWDQLKFAIPGVGWVTRKFCIARFCHNFAAMYSAGIGMLQGVEVAARSCGNQHLARALMKMLPELRQGAQLADVFERTGQFPNEVIHMTHTGERTGDLDSLLHKVAEYMEDEADATANKALLLVLPILLLITGVVFLYKALPLLQEGYLGPIKDAMDQN